MTRGRNVSMHRSTSSPGRLRRIRVLDAGSFRATHNVFSAADAKKVAAAMRAHGYKRVTHGEEYMGTRDQVVQAHGGPRGEQTILVAGVKPKRSGIM